jgi:hypothetical protein
MYAALNLIFLAGIAALLLLVLGTRLAVGGVRLVVWMFTTTAGWVVTGVLLLAYIFLW